MTFDHDDHHADRHHSPEHERALVSTLLIPTGTERRVCQDITRRQSWGVCKYGKTVEDNPLALRAWLQHAYEETLDQAIYLRRAIEQIDRDAAAATTHPART